MMRFFHVIVCLVAGNRQVCTLVGSESHKDGNCKTMKQADKRK